MCFLDAIRNISTNRSLSSGMASISSILLSKSAENPSQSAFFRLNVLCCATITGFILTQIGRCCVWGIGSRTVFSHIFEMFDDANMRSVL